MFKFFIIDRYILKELSLNVAGATMILMLIFGGIRFIHLLGKAAEGAVPGETIFALAAYESVGALILLLPLAAFLSVILVLGRMGNDGETIALFACGISRNRLLQVVLLFGLILAIASGFISLYLAPLALAKGYRLEQQALLAAETSGLVAGGFKETNNGQRIFYAESLAKDRIWMKNIFIQAQQLAQKIIFRATAGRLKTDEVTGDKHLILENGYRYDLANDGSRFRIFRFIHHGVLIKKGGTQEFKVRHKTIPTLTLWEMGTPKDISEVQWRLSMPIATVLLAMLAVPLTRPGPRQGRYAGLVPAILAYIIYSNTLGIARNWVERGTLSTLLGLWWVHGIMLLVVLILLWPQSLKKTLHQLNRFRIWMRR
ncbi:YjgP/YjgQ family permease [Candidatus Nitrosoglobus terrae]|uniref:Lipopolysaccharide export system permease protein LptF n=1 Tax=Candidatus Nitrosoglobus terrae TaxID=1630141 RepID=A0A1Q2SMU7_9GAMM|nr:LPS export ABC transporter permease LptF [Candidatus Nitrosoglobus terrae]BAW80454.1 YjgP/YjgQ family permease [Candidatus Nitrosoglobus terrae]